MHGERVLQQLARNRCMHQMHFSCATLLGMTLGSVRWLFPSISRPPEAFGYSDILVTHPGTFIPMQIHSPNFEMNITSQ